MDKMNFSAKAVVGACATCVVLIMSSLVMSACNPQSSDRMQNTDTNSATQQNQSTDIISTEDAKTAALAHAGVAAKDAKWHRAEIDRDNGRRVYEIEFSAGEYEYDYEIDASSGEIVKFDKEIR